MVRIIITLLSSLVLWMISSSVVAGDCNRLSSSMTVQDITARIKPIGTVESTGPVQAAAPEAAEPLAANAGELRYKSTCSVCHQAGVGGAPKFRDAADWKSRMDAGIDGMLAIAKQGKGAMPPKGTCTQCSDEELRKAIEYMLPTK